MLEEILKVLQDEPPPGLVEQVYHIVHSGNDVPIGYRRSHGPRIPVTLNEAQSIIGSLADDPDFPEMIAKVIALRSGNWRTP